MRIFGSNNAVCYMTRSEISMSQAHLANHKMVNKFGCTDLAVPKLDAPKNAGGKVVHGPNDSNFLFILFTSIKIA